MMKKLFILFSFIFLTACSKGIDDVEIGMTTKEVTDILGEPSLKSTGSTVQMFVQIALENQWEANSDEEHVVNTDEKFQKESFDLGERMQALLNDYDDGELIEMYSYDELESEFGSYIRIFFSDNKVVAIDKVHEKLIPVRE